MPEEEKKEKIEKAPEKTGKVRGTGVKKGVDYFKRFYAMICDTKKNHKSWQRNLFHLKTSPIKEAAGTSLSALKNLAVTKEQKDIILNRIERETIPSVRAAWIDYFLEKTKPFKCKKE
jgi:hypothetical protein